MDLSHSGGCDTSSYEWMKMALKTGDVFWAVWRKIP